MDKILDDFIITTDISLEDEVLYSQLNDDKMIMSVEGMQFTLDKNLCVLFESGNELKNYKLLLRSDIATGDNTITCTVHPQSNLHKLKLSSIEIDAITLTVPFLIFNVVIIIYHQQEHKAYFTLHGNLEFF